MATFQIHQDIENINPLSKGIGKTKIQQSKICVLRKRPNESRLAFQPVNSKHEPEVKRRKFNNVKEISKISVIMSFFFALIFIFWKGKITVILR